MAFVPTYCPILPEPTMEMAEGLAHERGMSVGDALAHLHGEREKAIERMEQDPLRYGYEPPVWGLCDALLGLPWVDRERAEAVRAALGFARPVRTLLILGGNRASKTEYLCSRAVRVMFRKIGSKSMLFHTTHDQSVTYHHSVVWKYLPPELRRRVKTPDTDISWTQKNGFSLSKLVVATSETSFKNYSQDVVNAVEGAEQDYVGADETVPADWVETLELRMATRDGVLAVGFTPVEGYSATCGMFLDGATPVLEQDALLLPTDGGPQLEAIECGLEEWEWQELEKARIEKRAPLCIMGRPRDPAGWVLGGQGSHIRTAPPGRTFEVVPRVLRCSRPERAVVFFHSSDMPFGNPAVVAEKIRGATRGFRKERFYGVPEKAMAAKLVNFRAKPYPDGHIVAAAAIPREGSNYMFIDPCGNRRFFMLWGRRQGKRWYIYREWPGRYVIPGEGVPGPWAEPATDGKHMDGRRGIGQRNLGWGAAQYKQEIARLEGWRDYEEWSAGRIKAEWQSMGQWDMVRQWDQYGPAQEKVRRRFIDIRFAHVPGTVGDRQMTLIDTFDEVGLTLEASESGDGQWKVDQGVQLIVNALAYDATKPMEPLGNMPDLFISEECENLIFAAKTWTFGDGTDGATKDPIDCLRGLLLNDCPHVDDAGGKPWVTAGEGMY